MPWNKILLILINELPKLLHDPIIILLSHYLDESGVDASCISIERPQGVGSGQSQLPEGVVLEGYPLLDIGEIVI